MGAYADDAQHTDKSHALALLQKSVYSVARWSNEKTVITNAIRNKIMLLSAEY